MDTKFDDLPEAEGPDRTTTPVSERVDKPFRHLTADVLAKFTGQVIAVERRTGEILAHCESFEGLKRLLTGSYQPSEYRMLPVPKLTDVDLKLPGDGEDMDLSL